jgi:hypothetical protein
MKEINKNGEHELIAKVPKDINPLTYNIEIMRKDIEA